MIAEKPSWVRHEGMQIFSIDVQPGGFRFVTGGGDHKVRIWNMKSVCRDVENDDSTQRLLATLRDHFGSVNCVRWAKHGRYVASGSDDQVILIHERKPGSGTTEFGSGEPPDIENWKVAMTLRGHTADVERDEPSRKFSRARNQFLPPFSSTINGAKHANRTGA
ncbi:hypothetical protein RIF29_15323 [Crotalaria pallida]|uniref:Uncharacterized protein n=1 Tax=Crotalaria pallida TaxID=3830 RepID=A0AAN9FCY5_CROPI